jgi:FMN reductase
MQTLKLVAVSAGLSSPSSTRLLADRLLQAARYRLAEQEYAVDVEVIELRDLAVDIANNLVTGFPSEKLQTAIDAVTGADGVVAVTPVFTASYSGLFKSFFDLIDPAALTGTPVLVAATGGTARHSLVLDHALRPLFAYLRAQVVPTAVYAASEDWRPPRPTTKSSRSSGSWRTCGSTDGRGRDRLRRRRRPRRPGCPEPPGRARARPGTGRWRAGRRRG